MTGRDLEDEYDSTIQTIMYITPMKTLCRFPYLSGWSLPFQMGAYSVKSLEVYKSWRRRTLSTMDNINITQRELDGMADIDSVVSSSLCINVSKASFELTKSQLSFTVPISRLLTRLFQELTIDQTDKLAQTVVSVVSVSKPRIKDKATKIFQRCLSVIS